MKDAENIYTEQNTQGIWCMLTSVCYLEDCMSKCREGCAIHEKQHAIFLDATAFNPLIYRG
ncbi:Uncharacterized protein BM_BM13180 [Brugia malayi]|uniref:Bm13180 n=1 Tax=Brugia malayi TaxID=6279 RepID=A0A0K0IX31_BRUMA|nr:Uncharacterized protein BM_BM13180 [Brugia malayi]CDQ00554.1 Bm13180 [Brugia malayi]VIO86341.1 Uncharacterized protein BM_BM13180 [Brugia malayi]